MNRFAFIALIALSCELFAAVAPTTQPAPPPQTTVNVPNGADLFPILSKAKANTLYLVAKGAAIKCNGTVNLVAGQDNITVNGNGAFLDTEASEGASSIFGIVGAKNFTLENFAGITGGPEDTLVNNKSANVTVTNNAGISGFQRLAIAQNNGDKLTCTGFVCTRNVTVTTASYAVFLCGVQNAWIDSNRFCGSYGESTVRCVGQTCQNGSLLRSCGIRITNNYLFNHNPPGKPPLQIRQGDDLEIGWNVFDSADAKTGNGWLRLGEVTSTTLDGCCKNVNVHDNVFRNCNTSAIQVYEGVSGVINKNVAEPTADAQGAMIAVGPNNNVTLTGNVAQYYAGAAQKALVWPANPGSYHASGNVVVIVPKPAATQPSK